MKKPKVTKIGDYHYSQMVGMSTVCSPGYKGCEVAPWIAEYKSAPLPPPPPFDWKPVKAIALNVLVLTVVIGFVVWVRARDEM